MKSKPTLLLLPLGVLLLAPSLANAAIINSARSNAFNDGTYWNTASS